VNPNDLTLWILGAVFAAFLGLIGLMGRSILQQGRDTNKKVTDHGEVLAALKVSVENFDRVDSKVDHLSTEVAKIGGAQELARAFVDALKANVSTDQPPRRRRGDA
jgi:monoamine oxidase